MRVILASAAIVVASMVSVYGLIMLDGLGAIQHETALKTVTNIYQMSWYVVPGLAVAVVATLVRARFTRP